MDLTEAGDCISFTATLLGVFTGVLNTAGLSLLGVFRIGLAFTPDLGVGGSGFMLKLTLLLGEKKSPPAMSCWVLTGVLLRLGILERFSFSPRCGSMCCPR